MNAIEFVKKFGVSEAKSVLLESKYYHEVDTYLVDTNEFTYIAIAPDEFDPFVSLSDLKQIVDAFELVGIHGSLRLANHYAMKKTCLSSNHTVNDLWCAIELVEKCNASD